MFCGKCGTQNPDTAAYCKKCGTKLVDSVRPPVKKTVKVSTKGQSQPQRRHLVPKRKRSQDKKVGMIAVAVVVAVVLIIGFSLFGGRSYKSTVKKYMNASLEPNAAVIMELIPEDLVDYILEEEGYAEDEFDELIEELDETLQNQFDYIERYIGEDWEMSYKVLSAENLKGDELEDLKDDYKEPGVKISSARKVEVNLTITAGETEASNSVNIYVIKVGRNWYLDILSTGTQLF